MITIFAIFAIIASLVLGELYVAYSTYRQAIKK